MTGMAMAVTMSMVMLMDVIAVIRVVLHKYLLASYLLNIQTFHVMGKHPFTERVQHNRNT
jgi:hypothetical protein